MNTQPSPSFQPGPSSQPDSDLPDLTAGKGGVWTNTHAFEEALVNPNVDLDALGMDSFRAIYSTTVRLDNTMKNIVRLCKLKTRTTVIHAENPVRVRFEINGTWISDGVAQTEKQATVAAMNNSLIYLIRCKGFQIIAAEDVPLDAIKKVSQQKLLFDTDSEDPASEYEAVRLKAANILHDFLMNPFLMKLELGVENLSRALREDIHISAGVCKLTHKSFGTEIWFWKINSTKHNLFDRPVASLAAKVPPVERILLRKGKTKKNFSDDGITIGHLQKPAGMETVFAEPGEALTKDKIKLKEAKKNRRKANKIQAQLKYEQKKELKRKGIVDAVKPEQTPPETQPILFDKDSINPDLLKSFKAHFAGFKFLPKRWKKARPDPLFLLEKSAICSGFLCKFAIELMDAASEDEMTVKLMMRNLNIKKEFWVSLGKGKTFAEAKDDCAKQTVYFLRTRASGITKFNNAKWNKFLKKFHHPEHVWSFSKKDLGMDFILSASHCRIQDDNIGFKILQNLGWSPNTGIGKHHQGIANPIEIWVGHSGYTGLGYKDTNLENGSIMGSIALEEILVRFKNNVDAWKLQFVDSLIENDGRIIMSVSSKLKLNSVFYQGRHIAVVWKPIAIVQIVGITTEKPELQENDYEISDEESLIPAARRHFEGSTFHNYGPGTSSKSEHNDEVEHDIDGESFYVDDDIDGETLCGDDLDGYDNDNIDGEELDDSDNDGDEPEVNGGYEFDDDHIDNDDINDETESLGITFNSVDQGHLHNDDSVAGSSRFVDHHATFSRNKGLLPAPHASQSLLSQQPSRTASIIRNQPKSLEIHQIQSNKKQPTQNLLPQQPSHAPVNTSHQQRPKEVPEPHVIEHRFQRPPQPSFVVRYPQRPRYHSPDFHGQHRDSQISQSTQNFPQHRPYNSSEIPQFRNRSPQQWPYHHQENRFPTLPRYRSYPPRRHNYPQRPY